MKANDVRQKLETIDKEYLDYRARFGEFVTRIEKLVNGLDSFEWKSKSNDCVEFSHVGQDFLLRHEFQFTGGKTKVRLLVRPFGSTEFCAASVILMDRLGNFQHAGETESRASVTNDADGVFYWLLKEALRPLLSCLSSD